MTPNLSSETYLTNVRIEHEHATAGAGVILEVTHNAYFVTAPVATGIKEDPMAIAHRSARRASALSIGLISALALSACSGAGGGSTAGDQSSINVLMVNNPQMEDLQRLTADNFTAETGITVNYTTLPKNDVRANISQEFSAQAGQYDVASLSNYEIPFYSANGWLAPLDDFVEADQGFNQDDIHRPTPNRLRVKMASSTVNRSTVNLPS